MFVIGIYTNDMVQSGISSFSRTPGPRVTSLSSKTLFPRNEGLRTDMDFEDSECELWGVNRRHYKVDGRVAVVVDGWTRQEQAAMTAEQAWQLFTLAIESLRRGLDIVNTDNGDLLKSP